MHQHAWENLNNRSFALVFCGHDIPTFTVKNMIEIPKTEASNLLSKNLETLHVD